MAADRSIIKQLQDSLPNEANLTEQELQDRLGQYQQASGLSKQETTPDYQRLGNDIYNRYNQLAAQYLKLPNGQRIPGVEKAADWASRWFLDPGAKNPNDFANNFAQVVLDNGAGISNKGDIARLKQAGNDIYNEISPQTTLSSYQQTKDVPGSSYADQYAPDLKRVQGLLDTMRAQNTQDQAVTQFTNDLPNTLAANRQDYLTGLNQRAGQQFNSQIVPDILQTANAKGLLYSGDVPDMLASGAAGLQSTLGDIQAQLTNQDMQFYQNAAYQQQLQTTLRGNAQYAQALASEQNRVLTQQNQNFQAGENTLNNNFQNTLYQNQLQRDFQNQQALLNQQSAYAQAQRRGQLYGQIGSAVGAIGGAAAGAAGGPVGIAAGAAAGSAGGSAAGQGLGQIG